MLFRGEVKPQWTEQNMNGATSVGVHIAGI
jgi:hypothetical protein